MSLADPLLPVKRAMQRNPDLAHSWHQMIICCVMAEEVSHSTAHRIASRIMLTAFDVEMPFNELLRMVPLQMEEHDG